MAAANKFDWKHGLYTAAGFGFAASMWLASGQGQATALALHITAATLAGVTFVTGYITHSLTDDALPPVVVAVSATPGTAAVTLPSTMLVKPLTPPVQT